MTEVEMTRGLTGAGRFTVDDVDLLTVETPYAGYFRMDRYRFRFRLFEGGWSAPVQREVFDRGHAAVVILYDPVADALVLIEQFRIGAFAATRSPLFGRHHSPWLVEFVAGIIEPDEQPEEVAVREAVEEAGCEITDVERVAHYLVSPGGTSESIILCLARVDGSRAHGIHGLDHEHEDIRVLVVAADEAFTWLDDGRITNAQTLIGLQWFRLNYDRIRARWLEPPST